MHPLTEIKNLKSQIPNHLTRTQQRILQLLPATPEELAVALYGRVTASERNVVYAHIALLRRRLNGTACLVSRRRPPPPTSPRPDTDRPLPQPPPGLVTCPDLRRRSGCVEGPASIDGYTSRIIYELEQRSNG